MNVELKGQNVVLLDRSFTEQVLLTTPQQHIMKAWQNKAASKAVFGSNIAYHVGPGVRVIIVLLERIMGVNPMYMVMSEKRCRAVK